MGRTKAEPQRGAQLPRARTIEIDQDEVDIPSRPKKIPKLAPLVPNSKLVSVDNKDAFAAVGHLPLFSKKFVTGRFGDKPYEDVLYEVFGEKWLEVSQEGHTLVLFPLTERIRFTSWRNVVLIISEDGLQRRILSCGDHVIWTALKTLVEKKCIDLKINSSNIGRKDELTCLVSVTSHQLKDEYDTDNASGFEKANWAGDYWVKIIRWIEDSGTSYLSLTPCAQAAQFNQDIHQYVSEAARLYDMVRPTGREPQLENFESSKLRVNLRPYQKRAAGWMVGRETNPPQLTEHPFWAKFENPEGDHEMYFNIHSGSFSTNSPSPPEPVHGGILADEMGLGKTVELLACIIAHPYSGPAFPTQDSKAVPSGRPTNERTDCVCGAKEFDWEGKTWVQCDLCSVWQHAKCVGYKSDQEDDEYVCRDCEEAAHLTEISHKCGATLIVCPTAILHQWEQEIKKHTNEGALKVMTYRGVGAKEDLTASDFAQCDIVLTTYDVLRDDIWYNPDGDNNGHNLRHRKKYKITPTPLTRLTWWRVCLDEAQLVRDGTVQAAQLASKLRATHRWAVTGSPCNNGVRELFGIMSFLKYKPFSERHWWQCAVERPINHDAPEGWELVKRLLRPAEGGILWRSSKNDVASELGLPEQAHVQTNLDMNPVERHFYNNQHDYCFNKARTTFGASLFTSIMQGTELENGVVHRKLTHKEEKSLLVHILRLRQACCHPQVGAGGIKQLQASQAPMTMEQILESLLAKAKVEAEEGLRLLLYSFNGLGALHIIEKDPQKATEQYRQGLRAVEEHKGKVKADSLQQLHALHNLENLLSSPKLKVVPTLRDSELQKDADAIRQRYMAMWWAKLRAAQKELEDAEKSLLKINASDPKKGKKKGVEESWYLDAVDLICDYYPKDADMTGIERIRTSLAEMNSEGVRATKNATTLTQKIKTPQGLKLVLVDELDAINKSRTEAMAELQALASTTEKLSPDFVAEAASCGRCRFEQQGDAGKECSHCKLDDLLMAWELRAFDLQTHALAKNNKAITAEDALLQARQTALSRVGRGGLGEASGNKAAKNSEEDLEHQDERYATRKFKEVSHADVIHRPCEAESLLKIIARLLGSMRRLPTKVGEKRTVIIEEANCHLQSMDVSRQKLFYAARAFALQQRFLLYAKDELEQSTMRMRLRFAGEDVKSGETHFKLLPAEVPYKFKELESELISAKADLQRALAKMRFLETQKELGISKDAQAEKKNALRDCPICLVKLRDECVVLPCGHSICQNCSFQLVVPDKKVFPSPQKEQPKCPTCREGFESHEMTYVNNKAEKIAASPSKAPEEGSEKSIRVLGSFSTKVEAIVRRILWLMDQDQSNKILVFSTWQEVLDVVTYALRSNRVEHAYVRGGSQLPEAVSRLQMQEGDFLDEKPVGKKKPKKKVKGAVRVLLLPIKHGANGLNLTDAQHVILVEPLVDPGVEAQAIGRVHRIGQKRKTYVHRFSISNTVEENVAQLNAERTVQIDPIQAKTSKSSTVEPRYTIRDVALLLQKPGVSHDDLEDQDHQNKVFDLSDEEAD